MNPVVSPLIPLVLAFGNLLAVVPRLPFSGVHGATIGAGSATGWERHGGENPAVFGPPGFGVSLAGYSPFGLDGLHVAGLGAARDAARWGASVHYRGLFDDSGRGAAASGIQFAWRPFPRWQTGVSAQYRAEGIGRGIRAAAGWIWNPLPALAFGGYREEAPSRFGADARTGIGADFGTRLPGGHAWRIACERHFGPRGHRETRWGAGFRFHSLLSAYAGWAPRYHTFALGIRFGMGRWEGFSALRRHAALGGTSIQGIRWRKKEEVR